MMRTFFRPGSNVPLAVLVTLLIGLSSGNAAENPEVTRIDAGNAELSIPAPDGYTGAAHIEVLRSIFASLTPESNVSLQIYIADEDIDILFANGEPELSRYMNLQAPRRFRKDAVSPDEYKTIAKYFRESHREVFASVENQIDDVLENASGELSREFDSSIELEGGKPYSLGIAYEIPSSIGVTTLTRYNVAVEGSNESFVMVGGTNIIHVQDTLLYAYVFSTYNSQADIDWNRAISRKWAEDIVRMNR
jgi:hypothetical protein